MPIRPAVAALVEQVSRARWLRPTGELDAEAAAPRLRQLWVDVLSGFPGLVPKRVVRFGPGGRIEELDAAREVASTRSPVELHERWVRSWIADPPDPRTLDVAVRLASARNALAQDPAAQAHPDEMVALRRACAEASPDPSVPLPVEDVALAALWSRVLHDTTASPWDAIVRLWEHGVWPVVLGSGDLLLYAPLDQRPLAPLPLAVGAMRPEVALATASLHSLGLGVADAPPPAPRAGWTIRVMIPDQAPETWRLAAGDVVIGRHADCGVFIRHGTVSLQHLRVTVVDGQVFVEDLASTRGTSRSGVRVRPGAPVALPPGDTLMLGMVAVEVRWEPSAHGNV
jgi:hypothetical protein